MTDLSEGDVFNLEENVVWAQMSWVEERRTGEAFTSEDFPDGGLAPDRQETLRLAWLCEDCGILKEDMLTLQHNLSSLDELKKKFAAIVKESEENLNDELELREMILGSIQRTLGIENVDMRAEPGSKEVKKPNETEMRSWLITNDFQDFLEMKDLPEHRLKDGQKKGSQGLIEDYFGSQIQLMDEVIELRKWVEVPYSYARLHRDFYLSLRAEVSPDNPLNAASKKDRLEAARLGYEEMLPKRTQSPNWVSAYRKHETSGSPSPERTRLAIEMAKELVAASAVPPAHLQALKDHLAFLKFSQAEAQNEFLFYVAGLKYYSRMRK